MRVATAIWQAGSVRRAAERRDKAIDPAAGPGSLIRSRATGGGGQGGRGGSPPVHPRSPDRLPRFEFHRRGPARNPIPRHLVTRAIKHVLALRGCRLTQGNDGCLPPPPSPPRPRPPATSPPPPPGAGKAAPESKDSDGRCESSQRLRLSLQPNLSAEPVYSRRSCSLLPSNPCAPPGSPGVRSKGDPVSTSARSFSITQARVRAQRRSASQSEPAVNLTWSCYTSDLALTGGGGAGGVSGADVSHGALRSTVAAVLGGGGPSPLGSDYSFYRDPSPPLRLLCCE